MCLKSSAVNYRLWRKSKLKLIKRLLTLPVLLSGAASAHPGHDHVNTYSSAAHMLNGTEPYLILLGLAMLMIAAIWLVKGR